MQVHQLRVVADAIEVGRVDRLGDRVVEVCILRSTRAARALEVRGLRGASVQGGGAHLGPLLQLQPNVHVVGFQVMVQDFAKRVPFASNREPKLGQVFLLFLCGRRDTGAFEPARPQ